MPTSILSRRQWLSRALTGAVLGLLVLPGLLWQSRAQAVEGVAAPNPPSEPMMADLTDVPRDLALMQAQKIPMLLFVHASYCGFCHEVDRDFIQPLANDPAYRGRLIIRRVEIDADGNILNGQGQKETNAAFARRLHVRLVPVVTFFDPDGHAVGEALKGITVPDFYGYYLDEGIKLAQQCAKTPDPARCSPKNAGDQRRL